MIQLVARFCGRCGETVPAEVQGPPSMVSSPEVSKLAEGIANDEETRANWRPDPEMLAAASDPKRRILKTEMGMVAVRPAAGGAPPPTLSDGAGPDTARERALLGQTLPLAKPLAADNAPRHAPEGGPKQYRTFLGIAMPGLAQQPTPAAAAQAPAAAYAPAHGPGPADGTGPPAAPAPQPAPAPGHGLGPPPAAAYLPAHGPAVGAGLAEAPPRVVPLGTLLGVATPGIAPVFPPPAGASPVENIAPGGPLAARSNRTLLGVSGPAAREPGALPDALVPGALTAAFTIPDVLPAPARPHREALPEVPELQPKRGIPMAPVVGGIAVALGFGGIALFFALKSAPPLTAQGRVDETGKEALSIHCPSCPDGTKLTLRGAGVEVKGGQAILPLADPLALGPNMFEVGIDRPAGGRDETVKLSVPVSYRVRADLGSLDADPPAIVVRVEAVAGSTVEVDGKPVVLSGGKGQAVLPLGGEVVRPSDDAKVVDRSVTFKVTLPSPARPESGTLPVRVRIVPLHLDAPGAHAVVAGGGSCRFTGQTVVGGKLTVNGANTTLGTRGEFATDVLCADVGPHTVSIVAHMPGFAARKAQVVVTKVASLEAEAKVWESKPLIAFDALAKPESVGKPTIVEGDVLEVRVVNGLAVALLDNRRGCKTNCFVRVLYGGADALAKGQPAKVFGVVTRTVTADGKTVPEVDAAFVERKAK